MEKNVPMDVAIQLILNAWLKCVINVAIIGWGLTAVTGITKLTSTARMSGASDCRKSPAMLGFFVVLWYNGPG